MSVAAIPPVNNRSADFNALQSNLQSGNLTGAQAAFAAFLQDVQKTNLAAGPSGIFAQGTPANRDLQTLGSALRSSNLTGAQQAFATLQKDIQTGNSATAPVVTHAHHHLTPAEVAANGVPALPASAASAASILNVKA